MFKGNKSLEELLKKATDFVSFEGPSAYKNQFIRYLDPQFDKVKDSIFALKSALENMNETNYESESQNIIYLQQAIAILMDNVKRIDEQFFSGNREETFEEETFNKNFKGSPYNEN